MKKLITILLATSLSLAAVANAAQEDPKAKKSKTGPAPKQQIAPKQNFAPKTSRVQSVHSQHVKNVNSTKINQTNVSGPKHHKSITTTPPPTNVQSRTTSKNLKSIKKQPVIQSNQLPAVQKNQKNIVAPNTKPIPNIQNIQAKYKNFKAQPKPAVVPSMQFNQNYQIAGAQNWSGPQYQVFSTYRPQWHDQGWWRSNYSANLLLIGGGWYYWNAGYWYPAWGYDEAAAYYPYDGPIYAGETRRPFDEVVADVQASLQEQGYYHGEVDGLMGPLTREALAGFQRDHGLITTAALDQPTLSSLGLG
ncbi:MAG: peptidoglycan-binding protein [Chthoniobacterales bacterium]